MNGTQLFFCLLLTLSINLSSCDKCSDISCTTPPDELRIQIIDKETGTDKFIKDTLKANTVQVINARSQKEEIKIDFQESATFFILSEIGFSTGDDNKNYMLVYNNMSYSFIYKTFAKTEECCLIIGLLEEFSSMDFTIVETNTHYKIQL